MLHPTLTQALANAHIEDMRRAAAARRTIRISRRRIAHEPPLAASPIAIVRSASIPLHGPSAPQADGTA